jgi:hypothetical protein
MNNSTFLEGTYGFIRNQLAGGGSIGATCTGGISSTTREPLTSLPASRCSTRTPASSTALLRVRRAERSEP